MSKKKRYNFTLDEDLMMWFKQFCKDNRIKIKPIIFSNIPKSEENLFLKPSLVKTQEIIENHMNVAKDIQVP